MIVTSGQLVDIRQVLHAENKVIQEPWSVLTDVSHILLLLLILHQLSIVTLFASIVILVAVARIPWLRVKLS